MKKISGIILAIAVLSCSLLYSREDAWGNDTRTDSLQDTLNKIKKPPHLTPHGKKLWRQKRVQLEAQLVEQTKKSIPDKVLHQKSIQFIKNALYGTERCYHSDDIRKYVPEPELAKMETFISKSPAEDKMKIYVSQRKKIENTMLAENEIQRKDDLEKHLHEEYKLFEDREKVIVKDIRGKAYEGVFRKDRTTDKLARIGSYSLSKFDIDISSRARIWQKDHDSFVKKELRRITRMNTYMADDKAEDDLDGKLQFMYLKAGYLPDLTQPPENIFHMEPKYWLSRRELVEAIEKSILREHLIKLFKSRKYVLLDIGDGLELVPPEAAKDFQTYQKTVAGEIKKWEDRQNAKMMKRD